MRWPGMCVGDAEDRVLRREEWLTRAEARLTVGDWIESWCNCRWLHCVLGYVSPVEFDMNLLNESAAEEPDAA